jgi:hypothetical protein
MALAAKKKIVKEKGQVRGASEGRGSGTRAAGGGTWRTAAAARHARTRRIELFWGLHTEAIYE